MRNDLVSGLDISATTLALGGVSLPKYLDGKNLLAKDYVQRAHVISARDRCDFTIDRIRRFALTTPLYSKLLSKPSCTTSSIPG